MCCRGGQLPPTAARNQPSVLSAVPTASHRFGRRDRVLIVEPAAMHAPKIEMTKFSGMPYAVVGSGENRALRSNGLSTTIRAGAAPLPKAKLSAKPSAASRLGLAN